MTPIVLILEDADDRIRRFTATLQTIAPRFEIHCWRSAHKMIAEVDALLPHARLISLDHDLYPPPGEADDPGDGLAVAKHLAARHPPCPVIIHSSNADRVRMMAGEFQLAGMNARTILPFGPDWIEVHWVALVRTLLSIHD